MEKERLLQLINDLDLKAEFGLLDASDRTTKKQVEEKIRNLLEEEEMKWALRAKVLKVVQGDDNTQFFHMVVNGKHKKKKISSFCEYQQIGVDQLQITNNDEKNRTLS